MAINSTTTPIAGGLQAGYPDGWFSFGAPVAVAPLGSTQANGAPLAEGFSTVAGANGTLAVVLPPIAAAGAVCAIYSSTSGQNLVVFPAGTSTITGGSAGASVTQAQGITLYVATSLTNWGVK